MLLKGLEKIGGFHGEIVDAKNSILERSSYSCTCPRFTNFEVFRLKAEAPLGPPQFLCNLAR